LTVTHQALEANAVSKRYGHTQALDAVSLTITAGEIHGLVGHNGAGKSTLLRLLSGAERPDSGALNIDGRHLELGSPREANLQGISSVYQELSLIEELTVAQNLFLGRELRRTGRLQLGEMDRQTAKFLGEYGLDIAPTTKVRALTVAQRQLIEVIAALHRNASFLLLDEPTTSLEARQVEELLATIRRVADERGVGVLLVDHKLDEVYSVADRVTALRNGRIVLSGTTASVDREDVIGVIVGSEADVDADMETRDAALSRAAFSATPLDETAAPRAGGPATEIALEVRDLTSPNLRGVSITARTGRVLGIYGLVGSGRTNLLRTVYGVEEQTGGQISLFGRPYRPTGCAAAIEAGIAYLPEDRKSDGFVPNFTPVANATLPVLRRYSRLGVLSLGRVAADARRALSAVDVRGDLDAPMERLSGGNQQKVLFGRVMLQHPRLLLLDEPTKGVDIGAKREIQDMIRSFVAQSEIAAIVVSSEEEEILGVSDDVAVFLRGRCDGTIYAPADLQPGDLRRLAWTAAAS
jgi:ABC-type sugar transport system ATPase subunit